MMWNMGKWDYIKEVCGCILILCGFYFNFVIVCLSKLDLVLLVIWSWKSFFIFLVLFCCLNIYGIFNVLLD